MLLIIFTFALIFEWSTSITNPYCELKCPRGRHTVCFFGPCLMNHENCGSTFRMLPLLHSEHLQIVHLHNEARNALATKNIWKHLQLPEDLRVINFDGELEFVAQCWANMCWHYGAYDQCRVTSRFGDVGQNVYVMDTKKVAESQVVVRAFQEWMGGVVEANYSVMDRFDPELESIRPFAQIMSSATTHLGCGRVLFGTKALSYYMLVCNYGRGGLGHKRPVYRCGSPCTSCRCDRNYRGLCRNADGSLKKWQPPFKLGRKFRELSQFSRSTLNKHSVLLLISNVSLLYINIVK